MAFATTLALVLMPLSYAVQVRFSLQQKADNYKADIDEMLLMRQRSSNAGAPSSVQQTGAHPASHHHRVLRPCTVLDPRAVLICEPCGST